MPVDNKIYLQIYLQQSCIPGDNRGTRTGMGLGDPRMQANKVTSVNALSEYLAPRISPVYNYIMLQEVIGYQAMWSERIGSVDYSKQPAKIYSDWLA